MNDHRVPAFFLGALHQRVRRRWEEVDVSGEGIDIDSFAENSFPLPERGDVGAAFVG